MFISSYYACRCNKKIRFGNIVFFIVVLVFVITQWYCSDNNADAASFAGFDPGYIISDYQMGNYNSMTEADIQAWLTAKNPCDNRDYGYYQRLSANVKYTWHWDNGHFVCLSEERFGNNDNEIGFQYGESAAHIIWQAAQDYKINPQVLLVLLQKETGLITDRIPNNSDYRKATGYGCPDTAACSSKYYGFKNQIRNAASLYRYVLDNGSRYYPVGNNYVQYNPNAGCGGTVVNIRNRATSSLYQYTPYQPNAMALAAGYGTGDACSSYGNRNFYSYFQDWFGGVTKEGKEITIQEVRSNMVRVPNEQNDLAMKYNVHVANFGWMDPPVNGGEMTGTVGYGIRMEAFAVALEEYKGIEYRSHIQDVGWENVYHKDGEVSGTTGRSLRIEAVQIRLNSELSKNYDIYYRVHAANIGWMEWMKNGEVAGTTGEYRQLEAIQIKIIKKDYGPLYEAHVADYGWLSWMRSGGMAGTVGESRRMEAVMIKLPIELTYGHSIYYRTHVSGRGWLGWSSNGRMSGTVGESRQMEAIQIQLDAGLARDYDVNYRVHVANIGWQPWLKNGQIAGTTGRGWQMEALEIRITKK